MASTGRPAQNQAHSKATKPKPIAGRTSAEVNHPSPLYRQNGNNIVFKLTQLPTKMHLREAFTAQSCHGELLCPQDFQQRKPQRHMIPLLIPIPVAISGLAFHTPWAALGMPPGHGPKETPGHNMKSNQKSSNNAPEALSPQHNNGN